MIEPLVYKIDPELAKMNHEQFMKILEDVHGRVVEPLKFMTPPVIVDFDTIYQTSNDETQEHVVSIMKFADGTETKCILDISEDTGNQSDDYTAFLTCYCKKILGDDFHKTWRYWTEKRPDQKWKEQLKEISDAINAEKAAKVRQERRERKRFKRMVKQKELELRAEREALKRIGE